MKNKDVVTEISMLRLEISWLRKDIHELIRDVVPPEQIREALARRHAGSFPIADLANSPRVYIAPETAGE